MTYSKQQIVRDIEEYMRKNGGPASQWYIGIATNARERLFQDHNVQEKGDAWIFRQAESSQAAREVEKDVVDRLGTDGGAGGGDASTDKVYAYKKKSHTTP